MAVSSFEVIRMNLEAKRRELTPALGARDGIAIDREPDELDNITLAVEREIASADMERRSTLVRDINDALARLNVGEYGLCVRCGVEIAPARLRSVPWTRYCLHCQAASEPEQRTLGAVLCRR
jgi:DnaK suppressor protein